MDTSRARALLVGVVLALAVGLLAAAPASAYRGDHPVGARHHALGGCVHNTETHVLDCIDGYYRFTARARGHRHTFWGIHVSAQRCQHGECHGRIWHSRIVTPYRLGRKGRTTARSGCGGVFSPFAICWADQQISKAIRAVDQNVIEPCVFGGAAGFGGALTVNITVRELFRGGLITVAQQARYFTGPVGFAIITVGTCSTGIYAKGLNSVSGIFD